MKRVFSGIQPTGFLHIGNYLGALRQWIELQQEYDCLFAIVDLHAITVPYNPKTLKKQILETALDLLALGLDPKKAIFFVQSQVEEHTYLAWLLNTITPLSELKRMTQFKEKSKEQKKEIRAGLLNYPVLMAADILLYKAEIVPVGEDQLQHVELARLIARKFNQIFGETFPLPQARLLKKTARVKSLLKPEKKMSKSLGEKHCIFLKDEPEIIRRKLQKAVTGTGTEIELPLGAQNLINLLKEFGTQDEISYFEKQIRKRNIKFSELKETLAYAISEFFAPFREERKKLAQKPALVEEILKQGTRKARKIARENLKEIKQKIGLF